MLLLSSGYRQKVKPLKSMIDLEVVFSAVMDTRTGWSNRLKALALSCSVHETISVWPWGSCSGRTAFSDPSSNLNTHFNSPHSILEQDRQSGSLVLKMAWTWPLVENMSTSTGMLAFAAKLHKRCLLPEASKPLLQDLTSYVADVGTNKHRSPKTSMGIMSNCLQWAKETCIKRQ